MSPLPQEEASLAFLTELDKRARSEGDFGLDYFCCNDYEIPFAVKSDTTREQTGRIEAYMEKTDRAILSGDIDEIEKYIAIDTFVDMYLLEEFSKDRDVGFSSLFFVKRENGKLECTAPWDFDLALGNDNGADTGEDHKSPEGVMARRNRWFDALYEREWFRRLLSDRLSELSPVITALRDEVTAAGYRLRAAAEKNYKCWEVMGEQLYMEPDALAELPDYLSHVRYLAGWMGERLAWMREYYLMPLPGANDEGTAKS